ncbi:MAG: DDE-type integrase/transposase/recombinase [Nitrosarchaeum sp.]|nr:DDE-type integrase/transposase/recombinase [Nitrosarchaeum sp.]
MYQTIQAEEERKIRGLAIVSIANQIKRINKLHYRVRSQSNENLWYDVVKQYGQNLGGREDGRYTCTCPDFKFRSVICKHIHSVHFSKELRKKIVSEDVIQSPVISLPKSNSIECVKCKTEDNIVKDGKRYNKKGVIQKYLCRNCDYRFVVNIGFENSKKDPKLICACIDLYFKGVSLRKVADHVKQFYGVSISNVSVLRWVQRFGEVVAPFVDSLKTPNMSGIFHVDEMVVHVRREEINKGHYQWLWNYLDETTRFWVTSMISQRREISDARAVFQDAKNKTTNTKAVIHDGLFSYDKAFQKEFHTMKTPRVMNIRSVSVRKEGLNSKVERLNGTMRDREKVMRGMNTRESSQKLIEAMRIHYNFIREHSSLGKTPAEQAGVNLELGENKIKTLLELSSKKN